MQKQELRKFFIQKRLSLQEKEVCLKSEAIKERFVGQEFYRSAGVIALYSSFKGEVRTDSIIGSAFKDQKDLLVPRVDMENDSMKFVSLLPEDDLSKISDIFSDFHQAPGETFSIAAIDLIVVPGVAFDMSGNRLGMGKGFYDRILKDVSKEKIVALAYEFQLIEKIPVDRHDIGVGWIITEERILKCCCQ